ncbi:LysM peptidoglycan-binding domain-containing protein [Streptomyces sp. NPDC021100]|uniref:LysM peptidoglycan-binding domain-containing protein n=1 Tax=Streptomyces sp. NPDC021100 TaxID=3365114 RepID=UPI0037BDE2BC
MAHRTPGPVRTLGALLRALLGLTVLAALVGATPYLLLRFGHQPTSLTGGLDVLLQPDDGSLFLTVVTCIGWAGWASFALSAGLEIIAVLRRRSAPRIKGLGGMQSLAGFLVSGIVLLAPTAASAATASSTAIAATATYTTGESSPAVTPSPSSSTTAPETAWPQHTVTSPTESPWGLAEQYLGSGQRWKDIAALNPGIPELANGDGYLPQGKAINLPADARIPSAAPSTPHTATPVSATASTHAPEPEHRTTESQRPERPQDKDAQRPAGQPETVTVHEGDSLWSIADQHGGDPTQWPAIYEANKGKAQPDGSHLTDPDLILPGLELNLPHTTTPPADTTGTAPGQGTNSTPPSHPPTANDKPAAPAPTPTPAPSHSSGQTAPAPGTGTANGPSSHTSAARATLAPAAVWAGAGVLAAALVGTLTTRRILQQRRRRPGRRIPMPQGTSAATEQSLRSVQHVTGFDLLDSALRTLALNLAAAGSDLPVLEAAVLHDSRLELHLAQDTEPIKPFTATAGRRDLWTCSASSPHLADTETLKAADAPYPALVSIGWDPQGHLVLVDLEAIGVLHLAGDPEAARHVLQAIAVELATTSLPGHLEITALGDTAPGLETAVPERVARNDLAAATAELTAHATDQRRTLQAISADTLRAARLRDDAGGAWTPHIVLADELPDDAAHEDTVNQLFAALAERPRTSSAVITAAPATAPLPADAWTLTCSGPDTTIALPGSALPVRLQGLSDEHYADAIDLLNLAASDTDAPAPSWLDPEAEEEEPEPELHAPSTEHTGLRAPDPAGTEEPEPGSGPSLADVLADNDDPVQELQPPAAGPADVALPLATQALATTPPATVHARIPTPAPEPDQAPVTLDKTAAPDETTPPAPVGPRILLLGPVTVEGAAGRVDSNRKRPSTEVAAYLALHPGGDHHALDDALWPGQRGDKRRRNSAISRLRSWLGTDPDGTPYLPLVQDEADHRYRLGPHITCDWADFQRHARTGLADTTEDGDLALRRALALVRGRPVSAVDPQRYAWAEPDVQEMTSAIVDVACELSTRRREAADHTGALWAAHQGLLAAEEAEMLHRAVFLAHHAAGDIAALRKAAARLTRINDELGGGVDMEAETAALLQRLLPRAVRRPAATGSNRI